MTVRLIPWSALAPIIPYSRMHVGRLERAGRFPKRVKLAGHRVAWLQDEIDAWIADLAAARDTEQPQFRSNLPGLKRAA